MTGIAPSIEGRLLCASGCAYGIDTSGEYTAPSPYSEGVGWDTAHPPVPIFGGNLECKGTDDINACLVGANSDGILIAFRGTLPPKPVTEASIADWWQDIFESEPEKQGGLPGKVHHGFWKSIETLWSGIQTALADFRAWYPSAKLYMTGHSKGGPMASLSAARIHFDNPTMLQPTAVYTFASPHPGDTDFVSGFPLGEIPVTRFENHLDLVPFLVPTKTFFGLAEKIPLIGKLFHLAEDWDYAALGTLRYIEKDHDIIDDNMLLEPVRVGELALAMVEGEKGFGRIADAHSHECGGGYMSGVCPEGVCP